MGGERPEVAERADYAVRNTRVLARRVFTLLGDGEGCSDGLPDAMCELAAAVEGLAAGLRRDGDPAGAQATGLTRVEALTALRAAP